ncbi:MAG: DEAD/DEAH box helicase [Planctomycetes bacterium]|nr:DEAD/DEAH box helicase [Planctomycetota bacterium]
MSDFAALGVHPAILKALEARGYTTPTPIQRESIPHLLDGADLLGIAQTGTGKTAAFAVPMLQVLHEEKLRASPKKPRALVLAPTRELASQIADACIAYGKELRLRVTVIFGGVGQNPQVQALQRGAEILIATPGRLLDLINQGHCDLSEVDMLVLDEADRMLDMGFLPDVKRILSRLPEDRQSLLFSATMPADITNLAKKYLYEPVRVEVTPPAATADRVEQSVYFVQKSKKRDLLVALLDDPEFVRTLVFTRTKHGADRVVRYLSQAKIPAYAIHGNKSQSARERALAEFKSGKAHVLVATDIAARGIDVPEITHVVNFDLPNIPESYVHRIGRTARAGRAGIAISFCDDEEHEYLRDIQKLIKQRIPVKTLQRSAGRDAEPRAADTGDDLDEEVAVASGAEAREDGQKQRQRPEQREAPGPYTNTGEQRRPRAEGQQRSQQRPQSGDRRRRGEARPGGRPGGGVAKPSGRGTGGPTSGKPGGGPGGGKPHGTGRGGASGSQKRRRR